MNDDYPCVCKECEKQFPRSEMIWSYDCHGIPFRLLCFKCYERIMEQVGYDGQYYDDSDECIDYDY